MCTAAFLITFTIALQTAWSVPIIDGQIATRDHPLDIASPQAEFNLETELKDRARPPRISVDRPRPQDSVEAVAPGRQYPVVPSEDLLSKDSSVKVEKAVRNSDAISDKTETDNESEVVGSPTNKDKSESPDHKEGSEEEEDSVVSQEEAEILRTIILTLKDNPELIKVLLESEEDDVTGEDFSKQKAQVAEPEGAESWGTFQGNDNQMLKQIEKKWGQKLLFPTSSEEDVPGGQFLKNDGVIQLPVKTEGRMHLDDEEIKADISGLDLKEVFDLTSELPASEENKEEVVNIEHSTDENSLKSKGKETKEMNPNVVPGKADKHTGSVDLVQTGLLEDGFVDSDSVKSSEANQVEQDFVKQPDRSEQSVNVHDSLYNVLKTNPDETEETELRALSQLREHPVVGLEEGGGVNPHM